MQKKVKTSLRIHRFLSLKIVQVYVGTLQRILILVCWIKSLQLIIELFQGGEKGIDMQVNVPI